MSNMLLRDDLALQQLDPERKAVAQIQLSRFGPVSKSHCDTVREGEWAPLVDEEGFWTRQIRIQFVNMEDLRTFHRSANGFSYNMGYGDAVIDVLPRGGWGVLASAPHRPHA